MKNIILSIALLFISIASNGQYFRATLDHEVNWLIVKIQANPGGGDITMDMGTFEIFVRYADSEPDFSFGDILVNSTDFPDLNNSSFSSNDNLYGNETGFSNRNFIYSAAPTPPPTSVTYTDGTEYEIFRVEVIGADPTDMVDFEIAANSDFFPTYFSIIDGGVDLTDIGGADYFYGDTGSNPGSTSGTTYFESQSNVALPIELVSFTANRKGRQATQLDWVSSAEINASHYDIQRSSNTEQWTTIGKVEVIGESNAEQAYEFIDAQSSEYVNDDLNVYYRLQMVDLDGSSEYSDTRFVTFEKQAQIAIFPSPAKSGDRVTLNLGGNNYGGHIMIVSAEGRLVKSIPINEGFDQSIEIQLDIDDRFSSGMYRVISRNTQQQIGQFTVIR